MTNEDFDRLWDQVTAEGHASRLAATYPAWRRRQRVATGTVVALALMLAVVIPTTLPKDPIGNYEKVFCNRTGMVDQHWIDLADELLMDA